MGDQFNIPPFALRLWHRLTDPSPELVQPADRHKARLIAGLFLMSIILLILTRIFRSAIHAPESTFNIDTIGFNIVVMGLCYLLSRTRYYRLGIIIGIVAVLAVIYIQSVYRAYVEPVHLTDSTAWAMGMVLIGGLVVSWQLMLTLASAFIVGLAVLPIIIPKLTIYEVRFSLEFAVGMTALITITAILRQRDFERIQEQTKALTISEGRYRSLLEAGFEALIIHDHGLILDVNDAVTAISGYTQDELIGSRTINLVTDDMKAMVERLYREHTEDNLLYETSLQHKDGRRVEVEVRSRMIRYHGQAVRVIAMRDITQSKQSSEQIKNLFNSLDRVFYSFDARDNHMIQISPACEKLYGYSEQEFYGDITIWDKIIHPEDKPHFESDFLQITRDQHEISPFRIIRKNGEIRWVEIMITPVYNAANQLTRYDGLATDVTERRQIEAEQREFQAERERSLVLRQFITDASHDLRTPLATLYTSLYLLRRVSPDEENITRYLNTLEDQTKHLSRVLDDLFTMSRLDSPEMYVEKHPLDINQVMDNVLNTQKPIAAQKQLDLHYYPTESPLTVMADKDYLVAALNHIVRNAVQYTPAEGTITVRTRAQSPKHVLVEVTDTGIGIQPSEMESIYDRFYRSDRARKADSGGVGLGLSLARKIVEIHEGTIEAESIPGEGSIFRITLPLMLK
ncbi:MAG: PAS domain S-box protein [Anaerolineaceae bacterium]|nr:PAS domain S-box protein [Anaerolineaceae bacterium]